MVTATQTLDEALASIDAEHRRAYVAAAWKLAHGQTVDPKSIAPILARAGRTMDQLRRLVARMQARVAASADIMEADKLTAAANRASKKIGPLNEQIEAMQREYDAKLRALHSERSQAIADSASLSGRAAELKRGAYETLLRTAEDPDGHVRDTHNCRVDDTEDELRMAAAKATPPATPATKPHYGVPSGSYVRTYAPNAAN